MAATSGWFGPERLLADRQRALVERLGLGVAALAWYSVGQVVEGGGHVGMARRRAPSRGSPARAGRAARPRRSWPWRSVQRRQVVEDRGHVGMVRAERLLADRQRALVERLGLGVAALVVVQRRQVVQRCGVVGMVRAQRLLADRQRALVERLGLGVAALVVYSTARLFSDVATSGWFAERLLADRQRPLVERLGLGVAGPGAGRAPPGCSAMWRHRDAPGRAPSRGSPARAGRAARPRRSGPGLGTAPPGCSATWRQWDGSDRAPLADRQRTLSERDRLAVFRCSK